MQRVVADARQRGDHRLSLEVIKGNDAALARTTAPGCASCAP